MESTFKTGDRVFILPRTPTDDRVRWYEGQVVTVLMAHTAFRPNKFAGAVGIREIFRWAASERGKFEPQGEAGCDSGMCGS